MRSIPLMVAAAMLAAGCGGSHEVVEPIRPVLTQTVAAGAASSSDVYSGEVRARYETDVGFRVGGKLVARMADAGARVARGQPLARLDPEDAKLAAQSANAQLASAESDFALAKNELERHQDLLQKKFISASAFDAKQNQFNAAQAKLEQARSQAALSSNQTGYTTLVADADGVVISVTAEPGQVVAAGQPVLRLAHSGEKDVVVNAPENQLARFKVGSPVGISLWADSNRVLAGRIREIAGGADPVTRTYAVRVAMANPPAEAQLGMTANVIFPGAPDGTLVLLPLSAIARRGDDAAVWVVDPKSSQVKLRPVTVGQFREDGVTISKGLDPGDIVVTAGVHKLRENQVVKHVASL